MSHYTCMVIGDNPEDQLEPYYELECSMNREEIMNDPRAEFIKEMSTTELEEEYLEKKEKYNYETLEEFAEDYYGYTKSESEDVWGRWTNPKSKWDWYQLGGRWSGLIKLKEGANGLKGQPGVFDNEVGIDCALKGDIANFDELKTFAIVKDGMWYERGEMGWWAAVSNEKSDEEWEAQRKILMESLPDDTLISIFDCHI